MSIQEQAPQAPDRIEIMGEGIVLRQFVPEDAQAYFDLLQRNKGHLKQQHQGGTDDTGDKYRSSDEVLQSILRPDLPDKLRLGIWNEAKLVGSINLTPNQLGAAEIGYLLDKESTGHGYMTQAVKLLSGYAFSSLNINSLSAHVYIGNEGSKKVLERIGFMQIETFSRVRDDKPETLWAFELNKPENT